MTLTVSTDPHRARVIPVLEGFLSTHVHIKQLLAAQQLVTLRDFVFRLSLLIYFGCASAFLRSVRESV